MFRAVVICLALFFAAGCSSQRREGSKLALANSDRLDPFYLDTIKATAAPPQGWTRQPLRQSKSHAHETWLSPTGETAYGIIHFSLPFPVGPELALWGFLREMRKKEGDANLLGKQNDSNLPGIRFDAEGGRYHVRANLITSGWEGWAIYAGTFKNQPEISEELDLATRAREYTAPGKRPEVQPKNPA